MAGLFMTPSNSLLLVCSLGILLLQQRLDTVDGTMEMSGVVLKRSSSSSSSTSNISGMGGNGRGSSSSISSSRRSGYVNGIISTRIIDSFNLTKRHNCRDLCNPPHKQSSICPFRCQHRLKESRTEYSEKNRALTKRQTAPSDEHPAKEKSMDDRFTEERSTEKRPAEERAGEEERPAEEEESAEPTKTIAIEAVVRAMKKNTLDAVVSWEWPLASTDHKPYNFIVHWARVTCNADESFAHCDDPDMYHANTVWSWDSKSNFTLPNVTYNSRYWAEVEYDRVTSHKVWFTTRGCRNPADKYFKRCVDSSPFRSTSSVSRTDKNPSLHINVSCLHFDTSSQTGKAFLEWNSDEDSNNGSSRENTILIRYQTPKGPHLEIHHTRVGQFYFDLVPNRIYEIVVKAHDSVKETIYETLNLNISRDHVGQPCSRHDAEAYMVPTLSKESGHLLPSIVIAGIVMVVVILVCLLAVHRCRGIKRKLLKKTLLAKSNSYKSPPGAVPHHAKEEQLQMVMKDEWELNPEHVAIGGEVGQGAFGLVMTGIYQNAQVAIKVLKGEVLPSYKEELLREIALMKRIGKHPNIVSLVGAVTTQEPIALIMEYMPYGNLQTFLQKCRSEGEVRQTEKGMEVDYSPLDELTGTKETLIITSTDMLSFARQIAVAMEFLTDRKYVHRDLAARNVLVGQNKVVKLCDFGLARVVYNGDQYCKLTNGRLPLKWMALESIRDRIFTAQSDVWSYGVLLWEIATLGMTPYPDIAIAELFRHLIEGYRMEQPDNCSAELYAIMSECWCEVPSQRPTFGAIRSQLEALLSQHRNYLDLDCVEPPPTRTGCPVGAASPVDTELLPAVLTRTSRTRPTSGISLDCFSSTGGATAAAAHALTTTSNRMSDAGGSDYRYPREIRSLATSGGREPRTIQDNEDMFVQLLYSN